LKGKNDQMKVHSILFLTKYAFMAIWVWETVEMAIYKKSSWKKSPCPIIITSGPNNFLGRGQFSLESNFETFCWSNGHEIIHHWEENWTSFHFVIFSLWCLQLFTINAPSNRLSQAFCGSIFFLDGHCDHFYGSHSHKSAHHLKWNWMNWFRCFFISIAWIVRDEISAIKARHIFLCATLYKHCEFEEGLGKTH